MRHLGSDRAMTQPIIKTPSMQKWPQMISQTQQIRRRNAIALRAVMVPRTPDGSWKQPVLSIFLVIRHCRSDRHQTGRNWQTKAANQTRSSPLCCPWHGAAFDCITDQNKWKILTESAMVENKGKLVRSDLNHTPNNTKQKLAQFSEPETGRATGPRVHLLLDPKASIYNPTNNKHTGYAPY